MNHAGTHRVRGKLWPFAITFGSEHADAFRRDLRPNLLANSPFGGKERGEVQQNFTVHIGEVVYFCLQQIIKLLLPQYSHCAPSS